MGQFSAVLAKRLSSAVEKMPAFPKSVQRILELTRDINCLPKDLVSVIEKDPVITIKILKIVNSSYYSLPNKITSINQSVVYMGINTIKNLALNFSTVGMLPASNAAGFDIQDYLMHSLVTANLARRLAETFPDPEADPTDCYVAGLLHDFGKVVFAQFMPDEFRQAMLMVEKTGASLHTAEKEIIGADHTVVGAMLAERWQFPPALVACIGGHHQPGYSSPMAECLYLADQITDELGYTAGGNLMADPLQAMPERLGDDFATIVQKLGDFQTITQDAQTFALTGSQP